MAFKITLQLAEEECAAACVNMILHNYFKKDIALCEIRPLIKNTQAGTAFGDINAGLKKMGIASKIYEAVKDVEVFSEVKLPLITQIKNQEGNLHYVVIYKITKKKIYYGDPDSAVPIKKSYESFMDNWIPYIIEIDVINSKLEININDKLEKLSYKYLALKIKKRLIVIWVLSLLTFIIGLLLSTMYNTYFNMIIPQKLHSFLFPVMGIYLLISLIRFGVNISINFINNNLNKEIDSILSNGFFKALFNKSTGALEFFGTGETIATLSNVILIRQRFFAFVMMIPLNCVWLGISLFLLIRINLYLSVFVVILLISLVMISWYSSDKYNIYSRKILQSNKLFNDSMIDIFSNTKVIKEYQQENEFINRGTEKLIENIGERNKLLNFDAILVGCREVVLDAFNILLFTVGAYLILRNEFTLGVLLTYNSVVGFAVNPLLSLSNMQSLITQGKAANELLYNLLSNNIKLFGDSEFPTNDDSIEIDFNNVSFSFEGRHQLLKNINLKIKDVNSVAVKGANGKGKTTFGKLLTRQYSPDEGSIDINNINIAEISNEEFLSQVVYIGNDEKILSTTILDNILLGRDFELDKIEKIARQIGFDKIVSKFDDQYDTPIGKMGISLSLGQEQLVKIIRSTLVKKSIYVFDEITNGLDEAHKHLVLNYLMNLEGTKFFITHDKMLLEKCDQTININDFNNEENRL